MHQTFTLVNYTITEPILHLDLIKCYYCSFTQHFNTVIHTCLPTQCACVWGTNTRHCCSTPREIYSVWLQTQFQLYPPYRSLQQRQLWCLWPSKPLLAVWFDADTENLWFTEWDVESRRTDGQCITHIWFQTDNNNTDIRNWNNKQYTALRCIFIILHPPVFNDGGLQCMWWRSTMSHTLPGLSLNNMILLIQVLIIRFTSIN